MWLQNSITALAVVENISWHTWVFIFLLIFSIAHQQARAVMQTCAFWVLSGMTLHVYDDTTHTVCHWRNAAQFYYKMILIKRSVGSMMYVYNNHSFSMRLWGWSKCIMKRVFAWQKCSCYHYFIKGYNFFLKFNFCFCSSFFNSFIGAPLKAGYCFEGNKGV